MPTPNSESSVDIVTIGSASPSESAGKPSTVDMSARSCSASRVTVAVALPSSPPRIGTSVGRDRDVARERAHRHVVGGDGDLAEGAGDQLRDHGARHVHLDVLIGRQSEAA